MTQTRVLLVEDEDIIATIIEDALVSGGYSVTLAEDGQTAWELLQGDNADFDVILLDREMPRMNGMELLQRLKNTPSLAGIPVIMETSSGDSASVQEGLKAGAYYYLTKPFQPAVLMAIVRAAIDQSREQQALQESVRQAERPLTLLAQGTFHFRTLDDGRMLANLLARGCPEAEKIVLGLQELMVNAVEHGNLGITYAEKTELYVSGDWHQEIERRMQLPEYRARQVEVLFERSPQAIRFTITDEGNGFDWQKYLDFDPERAFDPHGRGVAMARKISFDQLEYQGRGNRVIATIHLPPAN